jgi:hypothetical protein
MMGAAASFGVGSCIAKEIISSRHGIKAEERQRAVPDTTPHMQAARQDGSRRRTGHIKGSTVSQHVK